MGKTTNKFNKNFFLKFPFFLKKKIKQINTKSVSKPIKFVCKLNKSVLIDINTSVVIIVIFHSTDIYYCRG